MRNRGGGGGKDRTTKKITVLAASLTRLEILNWLLYAGHAMINMSRNAIESGTTELVREIADMLVNPDLEDPALFSNQISR